MKIVDAIISMADSLRMEVIAADPETSERFAHALVAYAEEQVDQLTQRLRENQMRDAMESVELPVADLLSWLHADRLYDHPADRPPGKGSL